MYSSLIQILIKLYPMIQILFVICGVLLIGIILLRKGESGTLSSAFGGMSGDTVFGVKAQKQLDRIISYISLVFVVLAILLSMPAGQESALPKLPGDGSNQEAPKEK